MNILNRSIKVLAVTGGRNYYDQNRVFGEINEYRKTHVGITTIITGDASGADASARQYAKDNKLKLIVCQCDWSDMSEPCVVKINSRGKQYNALAGFKRNSKVIEPADALMTFWNERSPGTKDSVVKAENKKIPVKKVIVNY